MTKNASPSKVVIACLLGLAVSNGAMGQDTDTRNGRGVAVTNLLDVFESSQTANAYLNDLRERVARASGRADVADREHALVELGNTAHDYASTEVVPDILRVPLRREALQSLLAAADIALARGRIRYTEQVAALATELGDRSALDRAFDKYLGNSSDAKGRYLALNDYGSALAKFEDHNGADRYLLDAIALRPDPEDGMEARMRYVTHLVETGRSQQGLEILNQFDSRVRASRPSLALYRQQLMHSLGVDTTEADEEVAAIREHLQRAVAVGPLPKLTAKASPVPSNILGLEEAYAFNHLIPNDDSRNFYAGWIPVQIYGGSTWYVTAVVINLAEVIWNEARGESVTAQQALAWAVRNRATIDMNGADYYPGAEGHGGVWSCRTFSPSGPSEADPYKRYSCALHGGTLTIGASQSQMNDSHVSVTSLQTIWAVDMAVWIINGWYNDPSNGFHPEPLYDLCYDPVYNEAYPCWYPNWWDGNPAGQQEWRSFNYCAANNSLKNRLGNIGGYWPDFGNPCPADDYTFVDDNYFWGRKP